MKTKNRKLDIYDKAILEAFERISKKVTPAEIGGYVNISPITAKKRMIKLAKMRYLQFSREGLRMFFWKK